MAPQCGGFQEGEKPSVNGSDGVRFFSRPRFHRDLLVFRLFEVCCFGRPRLFGTSKKTNNGNVDSEVSFDMGWKAQGFGTSWASRAITNSALFFP